MQIETRIENLASAGLIAALEANMVAFWQLYGDASDLPVARRTDLVRVMTGIPDPLFNGIFAAQLTPVNADVAIEEIRATAAQWKAPLFWWITPSTQPADLGERLVKHGFVKAGRVPGMAMELAELLDAGLPLPAGLTIEVVDDPEKLDLYAQAGAVGTGFSASVAEFVRTVEQRIGLRPGIELRRYLGCIDGVPVASSGMVLDSGVAGIFAVATVPAARKQGIGAAMTRIPLLDALAAGYKVGTLQASEMGYPVYKRLGFKDVCGIELYLLPAEAEDGQ